MVHGAYARKCKKFYSQYFSEVTQGGDEVKKILYISGQTAWLTKGLQLL